MPSMRSSTSSLSVTSAPCNAGSRRRFGTGTADGLAAHGRAAPSRDCLSRYCGTPHRRRLTIVDPDEQSRVRRHVSQFDPLATATGRARFTDRKASRAAVLYTREQTI